MINWLSRIFTKPKFDFQPTFPIPPCPNGKRWVMTDIHGCLNTFLGLLEQLQLSKTDQLFLLGDLIHKGPSSSGVLEEIFRLQKIGYQVYVIRGNHEQMLIDCAEHESYKLSYILEKFQATDLLQRKSKVKPKYINFFKSLPYYFELDRHFLVHAGFNFKAINPFQDYENMMWIKSFTPQATILKGKHLIHGHVTKRLPIIEYAVDQKQLVIPLDNGCVYWKQREGYGHLLALELNSWELKTQENLDFKMFLGTRMAVNA